MNDPVHDVIVIDAGQGGLPVSCFLQQAGV